MELFTGERGGILQHAQILLPVNERALGNRMNTRLIAATERHFFDVAITQLRRRLIPRQGGDPADSGFFQQQCVIQRGGAFIKNKRDGGTFDLMGSSIFTIRSNALGSSSTS